MAEHAVALSVCPAADCSKPGPGHSTPQGCPVLAPALGTVVGLLRKGLAPDYSVVLGGLLRAVGEVARVSAERDVDLAWDLAPLSVCDAAPLQTENVVLRAMRLRLLILHFGGVFLGRAMHIHEVLCFLLAFVCERTVPILVSHARNITQISVANCTPIRLVPDKTLWLVIRFMRKVSTSAHYEVQSGAFHASIVKETSIWYELSVYFSRDISPLGDCNCTPDLSPVNLSSLGTFAWLLNTALLFSHRYYFQNETQLLLSLI